MIKAIVRDANSFQMYEQNPRMVPRAFKPQVTRLHIVPGEYKAKRTGKVRSTVASSNEYLSFDELQRFNQRYAITDKDSYEFDPRPVTHPKDQSLPQPVKFVFHSSQTRAMIEVMQLIDDFSFTKNDSVLEPLERHGKSTEPIKPSKQSRKKQQTLSMLDGDTADFERDLKHSSTKPHHSSSRKQLLLAPISLDDDDGVNGPLLDPDDNSDLFLVDWRKPSRFSESTPKKSQVASPPKTALRSLIPETPQIDSAKTNQIVGASPLLPSIPETPNLSETQIVDHHNSPLQSTRPVASKSTHEISKSADSHQSRDGTKTHWLQHIGPPLRDNKKNFVIPSTGRLDIPSPPPISSIPSAEELTAALLAADESRNTIQINFDRISSQPLAPSPQQPLHAVSAFLTDDANVKTKIDVGEIQSHGIAPSQNMRASASTLSSDFDIGEPSLLALLDADSDEEIVVVSGPKASQREASQYKLQVSQHRSKSLYIPELRPPAESDARNESSQHDNRQLAIVVDESDDESKAQSQQRARKRLSLSSSKKPPIVPASDGSSDEGEVGSRTAKQSRPAASVLSDKPNPDKDSRPPQMSAILESPSAKTSSVSGTKNETPIVRRHKRRQVANRLDDDDDDENQEEKEIAMDDAGSNEAESSDPDDFVVSRKRGKVAINSSSSPSPIAVKRAKMAPKESKIAKKARKFFDLDADCLDTTRESELAGDDDDYTDDSFIDDGSVSQSQSRSASNQDGSDDTPDRKNGVSFYHQFLLDTPETRAYGGKFKMVFGKRTPPSSGRHRSDRSDGLSDEYDNPFSPRAAGAVLTDDDDIEGDDTSTQPARNMPQHKPLRQPKFTSTMIPDDDDFVESPFKRPNLPSTTIPALVPSEKLPPVPAKTDAREMPGPRMTPAIPIVRPTAASLDDDFDDLDDAIFAQVTDDYDVGLLKLLDEDISDDEQAIPKASAIPQTVPQSKPTAVAIIADNQQIAKAGAVISQMRCVYKMSIHFTGIGSYGFVLSKRMGADRFTQEEIIRDYHNGRLAASVHSMKALFERALLVVEKDRDKNTGPNLAAGDKFASSKLYETALAAISRLGIMMLYSSSQEDTARIIYAVAESEAKAGFGIPESWRKSSSEHGEKVLKFLLAIPKISPISAWAISRSRQFACLQDVVKWYGGRKVS